MDLDREAVDRVHVLATGSIDHAALCDALASAPLAAAGGAAAQLLGHRASDVLQFLVAALQDIGPRAFLDRTAHLAKTVEQAQGNSSASKRRKRVAIYGGAFDPITNSHLTCAAEMVHSRCTDEVWLVPCGPRPDKPKLKTPVFERYCMCQVAVNTVFAQRFPVLVSDIECGVEEAQATYDLLCSLRTNHPDVDFSFVIGSDWLQPGSNMAEWTSKNHSWKPGDPESERLIVTGERMLNEFDFLVIQRPGYDIERTADDPTGLKRFGRRLKWMVMPEGMTYIEGNLSSTEVRRRTAHGATIRNALSKAALKEIEGLVPRAVLAYIRRHRFYDAPQRSESVTRRRVGIFGGAFDPVTNAHMTMVANIVHAGSVDEVWMVPSVARPDKPCLASAADRVCMTKLAVNYAFSVDFPVLVSSVAASGTEAMATYDLLCQMREEHPDYEFVFIVGSDWLQAGSNIAEWRSKNPDWRPGQPEEQRTIVTGHKLLAEFDFVVVQRPGFQIERTQEDPTGLKRFGPRLRWMEIPPHMKCIEGNLSSEEVRMRVSLAKENGESRSILGLDGLLPPSVVGYIRRRQLYSADQSM